MSKRWLVAIVTLACAIPAFALTRVIWPDPAGLVLPSAALMPFFIFLAVVECLVFGLGVAFLLFGYPLVARQRQSPLLTYAAFISIAWYLLNWWPHDNLHRVIGSDYGRLVQLEFGFHLTMQIAAAVLAYFFVRVLLSRRGPEPQAA